MRRLIEGAARLYPAKWQQRYGAEFHALLADVEPGLRQFFDVLGGALKMQLLMGDALYLKLGAAFAMVGVTVAAAVSLTVPRQYISSAVLRISPTSNSQSKPNEVSDQPLVSALQIAMSRTSLAEIIQRPAINLYPGQRLREPFEDVIEGMNRDLRIQRVHAKDGGLAVRVEFLYTDPRKAREVVTAVIDRGLEAFVSQRPPAPRSNLNLTVLDSPSLPTRAISPNWLVFIGVGLALGTLLGAVATFYIRQTRRAVLFTATGLIGCILGIGFSFLIPNRYISSAVIRIVPADDQGSAEAARQLQLAAAEILNRTQLVELLQRPELDLYADERSGGRLEDVVERLRDHDLKFTFIRPGTRIGPTATGATAMLTSFEYRDPYKAQAMVKTIVQALAKSGVNGSIQYLDDASLPQSPVFPNRLVISTIGIAFGVLVGGIWTWVIGYRRPAAAA